MNWLQQAGATLFGLNPYLEMWDNGDFMIFDPRTEFDTWDTDLLKKNCVFSNPAVIKVFKLQCDMFSLAEAYVYKNGKAMKNRDPFLNLIDNPNPFQQKQQFLWDFMFWKMMGNAYCYVDSDSVQASSNKMYWLDTSKMYFPDALNTMKDRLVLSDATMKFINDQLINYRYNDGTTLNIPWGRISHVSDLTNGVGNWFKGRSVIDTLFEIISNGRAAIKSKNISVRYAGKYMVAGQADPSNVSKMPLGGDEQQSIEQKMNGRKTVHAVKSMIDIKRFIEDAAVIGELDKSWWDDYYKVGNMFGIPEEVLAAFNTKGATYENQEKARGAHVDYTLQPAANQFCASMNKRFGYSDKSITLSWDHLPFTKVFAKDKAETDFKNSQALINYMKAGVKLDEINSTLDTDFSELNYDTANAATSQQGQSDGQSQNGTGGSQTGN